MDSVLSESEKLFFRGKYSKVLRMLEPQVFQYRDSYRFYLLLGYSCLYTADFGGGFSYLRRAEQLSPGDTSANLGIALVLAKRGETEEAIRIWLTILERQHDAKEAERGLKLIRESTEISEIAMKLEEGRLDRYLRYPKRKRGAGRFVVPLAVLALGLIGGALWFTRPWTLLGSGYTRPGLAEIDLFSEETAANQGDWRYTMSEEELKSSAEGVLDLLNQYRDNLARREINRLLNSNAPEDLKEKIRFLIGYIKEPSFATLKDNFAYREVVSDPLLYESCHVIWRGRAANVAVESDAVLFDLLVGYEDETVLEGIVPVRCAFPVDLEENRKVEVLGRVVHPGANGSALSLEAVSLHQLVE